MISSVFGRGALAVCVLAILAGRLVAQEVQPGLDARRSLQIPPQDILKVCSESTKPTIDAAASRPATATRPAIAAIETGPVSPPLVERTPSTRPASRALTPAGDESATLARGNALQRQGIAAQRESESKDLGRGRRGSGVWSVRDFWPLLSVLALIVVLAWIVKRSLPNRRVFAGSGAIEVLSRTALSNKQSLVLVRMGRRLLLLGVTNEDMNTLCLVEDPDQVAMLVGEAAGERPGSMTRAFARAFEEESRAYEEDSFDEERESENAGSQVRSLLDRVRHLTSKRNVA
jgi:flagellar biosynthetic protein FliO